MTLKDIAERLGLEVVGPEEALEREVKGGYTSDLLSDVIANAGSGDVWITLQTHKNIIAVASMKELAGIVIINNRKPENDTVEKAKQEHIPILLCSLPSFELTGRMYKMGITGIREEC